jgi:hypothetical protein
VLKTASCKHTKNKKQIFGFYFRIRILSLSLGMNPMELYVGQPEGVAFYSAAAQGKFFACYTLVGGNFRY